MEVGPAGVEQGTGQGGKVVAPSPFAGDPSPHRLDKVLGGIGAGSNDLAAGSAVEPRTAGGQSGHLIRSVAQETERVVDKGPVDFGFHGGLPFRRRPRPGSGDDAPLARDRIRNPAQCARLAPQPFGRQRLCFDMEPRHMQTQAGGLFRLPPEFAVGDERKVPIAVHPPVTACARTEQHRRLHAGDVAHRKFRRLAQRRRHRTGTPFAPFSHRSAH